MNVILLLIIVLVLILNFSPCMFEDLNNTINNSISNINNINTILTINYLFLYCTLMVVVNDTNYVNSITNTLYNSPVLVH